jgi:hypothetical protein
MPSILMSFCRGMDFRRKLSRKTTSDRKNRMAKE